MNFENAIIQLAIEMKSRHPSTEVHLLSKKMVGNFDICFYHDLNQGYQFSLSYIEPLLNAVGIFIIRPKNMKYEDLCFVISFS
jgi:hypothetical protein